MLCNNCLHKPVCGKFRATGGQVQKCDHLIANKERYLLKENGDIVPLSVRWIPVTERLPDVNKFVLVYGEGIVGEATRDGTDGKFYWAGSDEYCSAIDVTHWMPLPEPPKGE